MTINSYKTDMPNKLSMVHNNIKILCLTLNASLKKPLVSGFTGVFKVGQNEFLWERFGK